MGTLRIVAGRLRGRKIRFPDDLPGLRPTADRVRESLFNLLGQDVSGLAVLDLYAGTGALGIEALSRGARRAVFIEREARARRAIRENLGRLGVERLARVEPGDVPERIRRGGLGTFDLVLADPPYDDPEPGGLLVILDTAGLVRPRGRVVLEQDAGTASPRVPAGWTEAREARYGRTTLRIFRRHSPESPSGGAGQS